MEYLNTDKQPNIDWNKLKENKCPQCWANLPKKKGMIKCLGCSFRIHSGKLKYLQLKK